MSGQRTTISAESLDRYRHIFASLYREVVHTQELDLSEAENNPDDDGWILQRRHSGLASLFHFGFRNQNMLMNFVTNNVKEIQFMPSWLSSMLDLLLHRRFHNLRIEDIINRECTRRATGTSAFVFESKDRTWHECRIKDINPPDRAAIQLIKRFGHHTDTSNMIVVRWTGTRDFFPTPNEFITVFEFALELLRYGVKLSDYIICTEDIFMSLSDAVNNNLLKVRNKHGDIVNCDSTITAT